jgi:hypothetical protein
MPPTKKAIERHYLERFAATFDSFPSGDVQETEEPDFLIVGKTRTVGIELTELHRESRAGTIPQQASEAMRNRVVARAQAIYATTGGPPIRCSIHFQERHIEKAEVESLASSIAALATRNRPPPNESRQEEYDWNNRDYFPDTINTITVHRLDAITETHFLCPGATWVASLSKADIQRALIAKEGKYSAYRSRCSEAWLLIDTDVGSMSTWFQLDSAALSKTFKTSFDRVFVFRHFGAKVHELAVAPPSGA